MINASKATELAARLNIQAEEVSAYRVEAWTKNEAIGYELNRFIDAMVASSGLCDKDSWEFRDLSNGWVTLSHYCSEHDTMSERIKLMELLQKAPVL